MVDFASFAADPSQTASLELWSVVIGEGEQHRSSLPLLGRFLSLCCETRLTFPTWENVALYPVWWRVDLWIQVVPSTITYVPYPTDLNVPFTSIIWLDIRPGSEGFVSLWELPIAKFPSEYRMPNRELLLEIFIQCLLCKLVARVFRAAFAWTVVLT